jgi:hypothetical protein
MVAGVGQEKFYSGVGSEEKGRPNHGDLSGE